MNVKDATVQRFKEICNERNIAINELAVISGVTPSTVYSMFDESRRDVSLITVKKLCDGVEMSITDFFNSSIFENLEPEIK